MLRGQPLAVRQGSTICRPVPSSTACSLRRLPCGVRCAAAPENGGSKPPSRRLSSLEKKKAAEQQERVGQSPVLGTQAQFAADRGSASGPQAAVHHHSPPLGASHAQQEPEKGSWDDWMRYFYAMDDVVHDLETIQSELDEAVAAEDYRTAAALAEQRRNLVAGDCLGEALEALETAVAEERFADAAALRDESCMALMGWWVGRGDQGDPTGHLLHVTADFGRYVATAYTPRDIADMLPTASNTPLGDARLAIAALLDSSTGQTIEPATTLKPEDLGLPVLELFLRPAADGSGGYDKQAVALYAPDAPATDQEQEQAGAAADAKLLDLVNADGGSDLVETSPGSGVYTITSRRKDGPQSGGDSSENETDQARLEELEEDDDDLDIRTIDDLAASVGMSTADLGEHLASGSIGISSIEGAANAGTSDSESEEGEEEALLRPQWQGEGGDEEKPASRRSLRDEVAAMTEALLQGGGAGFSDSEVEDLQQQRAQQQQWDGGEGQGETMSLERSVSQLGCILQRTPAQIEWQGRDRFIVTVSEPQSMVRSREAAEAAAAQQQREEVQLKKPPLRIIYDGKEQQGRGANGGTAAPDANGASSSSSGTTSGSQRQPDGSIDVPITAEASDSEDVSVLLSKQEQQQQQDDDSPSRNPQQQEQQQQQQEPGTQDNAPIAQDFEAAVEAVRNDLEAGRKPSKDKLTDITRLAVMLANALSSGTADTKGTSPEVRWATLEGRTTYQRLNLDNCVKTDPFSGLYAGTFGPHGQELLQVSRQIENGQEWAVATKLTGDPNVPAGTVSWKALIGRGNRLTDEMYPAEMGVTARYKGQGQVAKSGFTNAKWVEGELLVFAGESPFVRGAQLGFTFDVHANQRYLIVLHRVELGDLFPEGS